MENAADARRRAGGSEEDVGTSMDSVIEQLRKEKHLSQTRKKNLELEKLGDELRQQLKKLAGNRESSVSSKDCGNKENRRARAVA